MTEKHWMTVVEAAAYSGLCRDTIYTACERGALRHVRVGGRRAIRLRADWIDEWLERRVVEAISRDAMATLRVDREADLVSSLSTQARALLDLHGTSSIDRFTQRLVDDFQQRMHDEFIDVSWPRCPRHPNHPLWLIEGIWRCTKDDVAVARLGELPSQE